jgi:hypothetical protein
MQIKKIMDEQNLQEADAMRWEEKRTYIILYT